MYPPHHYGGYELSCQDVVTRWRQRGHRVDVLCSELRHEGVADGDEPSIRRELPIAFRDGDLFRPPARELLARERRAQATLRDALERSQPDVVSVWHLAALSTGLLQTLVECGVPLVYVVCDDWLIYAASIDPWMRWFANRPWLGRVVQRLVGVPATLPDIGADGTFCFVSDVERRHSEQGSRWSFPRSTVTFSGIDPVDFPVASEVADRPWRWQLLQADRFDPRKGQAVSIRALAQLPGEARLSLLGRGDDAVRAELTALAAAQGVGDRVTMGVVPRAELRARYEAADALLFPVAWEEPFGLTPVEAMACGTPVVATAMGGSAEFLVDGVNALVVPPNDADSLAAAVRRLAADAALRRQLVSGGLRTAAELNADRLADVLEDWHLAAAARFVDGEPAHRVLDVLA